MCWWLLALAALAGQSVVLPGADAVGEVDGPDAGLVQDALALLGEGRPHDAAERLVGAKKPDADVRYVEAWARYAGGELRAAERVTASGLELDPSHGPLLALYGLVLADLGRGEEALGVLTRAGDRAAAAGDRASQYRVLLVSGLAQSDLGRASKAREAWSAARGIAEALGDAAKVDEVDAQLERLDGGRGGDVVGQVSEALARGDLAGARRLASASSAPDRRSKTAAAIAVALVQRAEGRLDLAASELTAAVVVAREGGLVREEVAARTELARVLHLAGRVDDARTQLDEAKLRVQGTSFKVQAVDLAAARGRQALLEGRLADAVAELSAAQAVAAGLEDKPMSWRLAELTGGVKAAQGDAAAAEVALRAAVAGWGEAGWYSEAARVAADGVRVAAAARRPVDGWRTEARAWFGRAGDSLAEVHIDVSEGLGLASSGQDDAALIVFARAWKAAVAMSSPTAKRMAGVAGSDAAEVLRRMKPTERALQAVKDLGLEPVVAEHAAWLAARAAYDQATRDFQAGRHADARRGFQAAVEGFEGAGERELAATARRGLAWATWNEATGSEPAIALPAFEALIPTARALGDRELEIRSLAAGAVAAGRVGVADAPARLREGAARAGEAGYVDLAARCWAELANQALPLTERAAAARQAFSMRKDHVGVNAMIRVAIAALEASDGGLASELASAVRPYAADQLGTVEEVLAQARR